MALGHDQNDGGILYEIQPNRSKAAFKALISDWAGILVSDGYGLNLKWVGLRRTCLVHLI